MFITAIRQSIKTFYIDTGFVFSRENLLKVAVCIITAIVVEGLISVTTFHHNLNSMRFFIAVILFLVIILLYVWIRQATELPCHALNAVAIMLIQMRAKWNFDWVLMTMEKSLVKWEGWVRVARDAFLTFLDVTRSFNLEITLCIIQWFGMNRGSKQW